MVEDDQLDEELDDVGVDISIFAAERQNRRRHAFAELANLQTVVERKLKKKQNELKL